MENKFTITIKLNVDSFLGMQISHNRKSKTISLLLGYPPPNPTILHDDNKSAIQIVHNGNDKGGTKQMDVRCHIIWDLVKNNITVNQYKPTEDMVADILTKPLDPKLFNHLQTHILGHLVWLWVLL